MGSIFNTGFIEEPVGNQGNSNRRSVSTLKPCAKDAYMLFQVLTLHFFKFMFFLDCYLFM